MSERADANDATRHDAQSASWYHERRAAPGTPHARLRRRRLREGALRAKGQYKVEVIDVLKDPQRARKKGGGAAPGSERAGAKIPGSLDAEHREQDRQHYVLKLYVTGLTPASRQAMERVRAICEEHLHGRYELEVVDIRQMPALAKDEQIVATPTLIKVLPAPLRRFIGNLANVEKVLLGLDLREKP